MINGGDLEQIAGVVRKVLKEEDEITRMQFAAISVISRCNTIESLTKQRLRDDSPYYTVAYEDVIIAIEREIKLLEKRNEFS